MFNELTIKMLVSIFRYLLFAAGVILVEKGLVTQELFDEWVGEASIAVAGIVMMLLIVGWRYLNVRFDLLTQWKLSQQSPADTPTEAKIAIREAREEVKAENAAVTRI